MAGVAAALGQLSKSRATPNFHALASPLKPGRCAYAGVSVAALFVTASSEGRSRTSMLVNHG
jgi:hypothetical protein